MDITWQGSTKHTNNTVEAGLVAQAVDNQQLAKGDDFRPIFVVFVRQKSWKNERYAVPSKNK